MMPAMTSPISEVTAKGPRVFLSSTYKERFPHAAEHYYFGLRRQLYELGRELGITIWVHECVEHTGPANARDKESSPDWIAAIEECLQELSQSDLVVVVLGHRAGTPIEIDDEGNTAASVLEVELFYASLKRIPVVFYALRGYEPDTELLNLIEVLDLKGSKNWFEIDERDVLADVRALLAGFPAAASEEWKLRFFHDRLANRTSFLDLNREIYSSKLSFIGRFAPRSAMNYSPARFYRLLGLAEQEPAHNASRLGLLWMALREVSVGGWRDDRADEWQHICDRWPAAAAWTGIHGTLSTSTLAAFHTRNDLLRRRGRLPEEDIGFPFGPMASELYSMGLICETPRWKRRRFEAAIKLATRHLDRHPGGGALGIRASAHLRLAQLGRPWHIYSALSDYREGYRVRERSGASASALGESLSEWAFAEFQLRNRIHFRVEATLNKLREGVRLMETAPDPHKIGFLIRGKRKLAQALSQVGQHDEAAVEHREAEELARSFGILGQLKDRGS